MIRSLAVRFGRRSSAAVLEGANRVLQGSIVAALLAGLRRRDPSAIVNGVVSLVFASLPAYVEREYGVRFRPWQRLWVSAAALVHATGMLGPYDRIWWWDHVAHTLTATIVAGATDALLRGGARRAGTSPISARSRAVAVVGTTLGIGLLWEALEYVVHVLADRIGLEPLLVHYGRRDTARDLLYDALGACLVVLFGRSALSNVVDSLAEE